MDVLIYGDSIRSPDLRHAVPVAIGDSFAYAERDGRRYAFISTIEAPRIRAAVDLEVVPPEELGLDERSRRRSAHARRASSSPRARDHRDSPGRER